MTDKPTDEQLTEADPTGGLATIAPSMPIAPAHGIAAIALNMAMKYHDMNMIHDGALYQQYKLEGKNMRSLHLNDVFETAIKIEMHLMASSQRIAAIVVDAIAHGVESELDADGEPSAAESAP